MSKPSHIFLRPSPGQEDQSARLAASAEVGQVEGTTSQSIRKSSSRALPAGDLSGISTHLNPGGADGACADGAAGSLSLASETPSLTPALMAEYSTQYVSSSPIPAAMNGNSSPNPINPTAASPSVEAADLKAALGQVDQEEGTSSKPRYQFRKSVGLFAFHGEELKAIAKEESRSVESVMRSLIVLGLVLRREKGQGA